MANKIDLGALPPLKALRGFEAATRHQSIRNAADELCLTHPAVSHQVQLIEEALGVELFVQDGRHIVSTDQGRVLYPYVRAAFESLIEGVEAVHRNALDKPLRVQTYVTASIRWLARRVPQFLADHPEVKLELRTCAIEWEFDDVHADVGLVYCPTQPDPKYHWVPLFDYALYPVCSPAIATRLGPAPTPAAILAQPLVAIYTEVQNWQTWFEAAGIAFDPASPYLVVDTLAVALEMALDGQAVALVNGPFVDADLASGRLVRPVAHRVKCPGAWGLICRKDMKENPRIRKFIDWMAAHAAIA
ncbi:MAG: LysR substrate-binding domain-containing protein [Sphingomonadaceae bacterium]